VLPEELRGWNWGAFLLDFAWGVGNRVWWAAAIILVWLVVYLTPMPAKYMMFAILMGAKILLGFKGSEWAWQSRPWASVQQFKLIQRMWMNWGVILTIIFVILWVLSTRSAEIPEVPTS